MPVDAGGEVDAAALVLTEDAEVGGVGRARGPGRCSWPLGAAGSPAWSRPSTSTKGVEREPERGDQ